MVTEVKLSRFSADGTAVVVSEEFVSEDKLSGYLARKLRGTRGRRTTVRFGRNTVHSWRDQDGNELELSIAPW